MKKKFLFVIAFAFVLTLAFALCVCAMEAKQSLDVSSNSDGSKSNDPGECLEQIFSFKGYSYSENGSLAAGFEIDYEALALYEKVTGKKLQIGVLFAGYENLGGKQPLDENGKAIQLEQGKVSIASLTKYTYPQYDFILTDIDESLRDVSLVMSAYITNGIKTYYVQENGLADTVSRISYNQIKKLFQIKDENGFTYMENNGKLTITGYEREIDSSIAKGIKIPYSYNGMDVVAIEERAFSEFGKRFSTTQYALSSSEFVKLYVPASVVEIGDYAFENCVGIKVVLYNRDNSTADYRAWDENVYWGSGNRAARDTVWGFRPAIGWTRYSMVEIPDDYE